MESADKFTGRRVSRFQVAIGRLDLWRLPGGNSKVRSGSIITTRPTASQYNGGVGRRRFFVDAIHDGIAELRGEDAWHVARVLRAAPGQHYEISDNRSAWLAEVVEAQAGRVVFRVMEPVGGAAIPVQVTVCASLIQFAHFEWMIEKATELGAARILPVDAARSEKGLAEASRKRSERWMRIARESSQQCRRVNAPEILPAVRLEDALATTGASRYFLDEGPAPPLAGVLAKSFASPQDGHADAAVLVGPEGGWTDAERHAAISSGWRAVSLSPLVLRAETAVAAALAILVNVWQALQ
jgi:16S rRNA (uracil1498-N3)-methyltransferase